MNMNVNVNINTNVNLNNLGSKILQEEEVQKLILIQQK